jgi:hypothetical protein
MRCITATFAACAYSLQAKTLRPLKIYKINPIKKSTSTPVTGLAA